jgi:mitotic spindle assembly checkpoint protein MAD2
MTTSKNTILLRGSTDTVADFFHAALSSILYQRGIYPPESFAPIKKYGLTIMAVKEDKLSDYLQAILKQFTGKSDEVDRLNPVHPILTNVTV